MRLWRLSTLIGLLATTAMAEPRDANYMPEGGYVSTTNATYVAPSLTEMLIPGQKIEDLTQRNFAGETIVQRLTDRSYWIQTGFYNTVAYVGDEGVLLLDPLGNGSGGKVLAAVQSVTDKPVTAVIYSHHHEDHIGDIGVFVEAAEAAGISLRIITTEANAEHMAEGSALPPANEILRGSAATTRFEDQVIEVTLVGEGAHSEDSAIWKLVGEDIVHIPDYVNPDQLPWTGFGGSQTFVGYEDDLRQIRDTGFTFFSGGHGNVGSSADFDFMLEYTADLKQAVLQAFGKVNYGDFVTPEMNNHQAIAHNYFAAHNAAAMDILRPKYGDYYGFEASVPYQIRMARVALNH